MRNLRIAHFMPLFIALLAFLTVGCTTATQTKAKKFKTYSQIVDVDFVKPFVKIPAPKGVMLIDSRPKRVKFDKGHIPTAVSIPFSKFDKMLDKLPQDKNTLLIFYCGGFHCSLSHKSAYKAEKLGYKNIKVYAAGFPDWMKQEGAYSTVSVDYMKSQIVKNANMVIVDSRPKRTKYDKGHLPNALSIPDSQFDKMKNKLPQDKSKQLVFYCGGFKCKLSHKSAAKAIAMGYKNVKVFAAGYPAWKKAVGATTVQAGGEEGTIQITQFKQIIKDKPESIMLIDVRDPEEFNSGHFPTAINIPTDQLEGQIPSLQSAIPIVFVCSTGARSGEAFYMVQDLRPSLKKVYYLEAEVTYNDDKTFKIVATP